MLAAVYAVQRCRGKEKDKERRKGSGGGERKEIE